MLIEEKDFRLKPINDASPLFDLELLRVVNKGKPEERSEFKIEGYGFPLDSALNKVAHYRASNKFPKEAILTIKQYVEAYQEAHREITSLIM